MVNATHRFDNAKRRRSESHDRQRMLTPEYVLTPVRADLGGRIDLDPCTEPNNPTGAAQFITPPDDGATAPWGPPETTVFCNPPYGESRGRWVDRCIAEGTVAGRRIILLIPAHTETRIFQRALECCDNVVFIRARVMFAAVRANGRHEAASHGSALLGWGVDMHACAALGVRL